MSPSSWNPPPGQDRDSPRNENAAALGCGMLQLLAKLGWSLICPGFAKVIGSSGADTPFPESMQWHPDLPAAVKMGWITSPAASFWGMESTRKIWVIPLCISMHKSMPGYLCQHTPLQRDLPLTAGWYFLPKESEMYPFGYERFCCFQLEITEMRKRSMAGMRPYD